MARTVSVSITADTAGFVAGINKAAASAKQGAGQIRQHFDKGFAGIAKNEQHLRTLSSQAGILGVGLAAGVGIAVKSFADFDKAMSGVAATGQDARSNLDSLRQAAIDAGAQTSFSATEAAAGLEALAKAGVTADQSLSGGLAGALNLAAAGGLGVADAAEIAATAMTQFGLAGSEVPHVADLLAAGAGKAQGEVSDLASALKQSGLVANAYGLSIEETTGSLAAFASAGLLGSDAGTSFKTMLQALGNPSKEAAQKMADLGISAYDAQGAFIGIGPLAEQLKTNLAGVSQETRNAALATIFGSDAVRAANVLYQEGAAGIQGWVDNVNDAGFAAETAATKMDNLAGDLEALGGSVQTALIGLGEGGNDPLRFLVQSLTDGVNAFDDFSGGAKSAILITVGSLAVLAIGAAGVGKLAVAANEAKIAFDALKWSAKGASIAALGIGGVLAVGAAAFGAYASAAAESRQRVDDLTQALQASNGALDANVAKVRATALESQGALQAAQELGVSIEDVTQASLGDAAARQRVNEALAMYRQTGSGVNAMNAGYVRSSSDAAVATKSQADAAQLLTEVIGGGNQELQDAIAKQQRMAEAQGAGAASSQESADAYATADAALGKIGESADQAATDLNELVSALFATQDAALAVSDAQIGFEAAVDAAAEAAAKNGRNLRLSTEAGRDNQTALNNLAKKSKDYVASLIEQGASSGRVAKATQNARSAFIENARAMGVSRARAAELATEMGLIPKDTKAAVSSPGAKASKEQINEVKNAIKNLPKSTQTKILSAFNRGGIDAARSALNSINGKTATTYIVTRTKTIGERQMQANAAGGYITGPGTATSDSIPAWLSNGEYVLRAAAVKAVGLAELNRLNAQGYARGGPVGFATGGSVDVARIMRLIAQALDLEGDVRRASAAYHKASPNAGRDEQALRAAQEDVRDAKRAHNKKALAKAEDALDKAEDRHKKSADKAKDALDALRQAQQALADAAKQTSEALSERYRTESLDIGDVLTRMREGAVELAAFQAQLRRLRALGLSEDQVRAISARGATQGGELAAQIIAGGKGLVSSLNKANANLDKAADNLGVDIERRRVRKAMGGLVSGPGTGTSDSVDISASNGEYMMRAAAVRRIGVGRLDAMNYGDRRVQPPFRPAFAGGGYIQQPIQKIVRPIEIHNTFHGINPDTIIRRQQSAQRDALVMANLSVAV